MSSIGVSIECRRRRPIMLAGMMTIAVALAAPAAGNPVEQGHSDDPPPPSIQYIAMHSNRDHASCSGSGKLALHTASLGDTISSHNCHATMIPTLRSDACIFLHGQAGRVLCHRVTHIDETSLDSV